MKDILERTDIEILVNTFYEKVVKDEIIGYIFTDIVNVNWEKHLPVMFDFWENIIFYTGKYHGDPMNVHRHLNRIFPLDEVHFKRWLELFNKTVDELFEGNNAIIAKQRALSIETVMRIKIATEGTIQ